MKNQKPFFDKSVVDSIINVFSSELTKENKTLDEKLEKALREYIQGPKHAYENAILASVASGEYVATVVGDEVAYKAAPIPKNEIDELIASVPPGKQRPTEGQIELVLRQKRVAKLTHAMNMVTMGRKAKKLNL